MTGSVPLPLGVCDSQVNRRGESPNPQKAPLPLPVFPFISSSDPSSSWPTRPFPPTFLFFLSLFHLLFVHGSSSLWSIMSGPGHGATERCAKGTQARAGRRRETGQRPTGPRDSGRGVSWNTEHGGLNKMGGTETTVKRTGIIPNEPEKSRN